MAALTIEVPDRLAEALGSLDAPLVADEVALAPVIRWGIEQVARHLAEIATSADPLDSERLRHLAERIEALADASEAVA